MVVAGPWWGAEEKSRGAGRTQTLPGGPMLETCWWPRHGSKEGCRDRPPTARWMQVWPFRHLQGIHKHQDNFPRGNKSIVSSPTLFPGVWESFDGKAAFLTEMSPLCQQRSQFSAKNVALGRKCSYMSNLSMSHTALGPRQLCKWVKLEVLPQVYPFKEITWPNGTGQDGKEIINAVFSILKRKREQFF